jgi:hypothetical protein
LNFYNENTEDNQTDKETHFLRIIGNDDYMQELLNKREAHLEGEMKIKRDELRKKEENLKKKLDDFNEKEKAFRENEVVIDPYLFHRKGEIEQHLKIAELKESGKIEELDSVNAYYSNVVKKLNEQIRLMDEKINSARKKTPSKYY